MDPSKSVLERNGNQAVTLVRFPIKKKGPSNWTSNVNQLKRQLTNIAPSQVF